ncbi:MAG TPA: class I poly(R)-hydroxyalkanoic acid synthase [Advenella kashmirensis]|uniref:Class I poly(R)-hydroxyalkanoic acid synthase n=1 Tax=Advenella kashmirensis TaxID=310575 RepID=A0A356LE35_9BURK|nr:class I poly(R)-hydroxyalkanoic acid synthase [Advenella kashmirensis]
MTNETDQAWAAQAAPAQDAAFPAPLQAEFLAKWQQIAAAGQQGTLPPLTDRRFSSPAWLESPQHLLMAHLYLLSTSIMQKMVDQAPVPDNVRERLRFSVEQWNDAMSPANYFLTNPDVLKTFSDTHGESLQKGFLNLLGDLRRGQISQTDDSTFEVGGNLATTPGSVVFENPWFQLLQYAPQTPTVYRRPLLMVPPCINKYYILDLQSGNSLVEYAVSQGFTVFMVSWRNPTMADTDGIQKSTWDDYIEKGVLTAIETVRQITGQPQINALGFCVGGTMLSSALAVARARDENPVASVTLLTTLLDFEDTGVLDVFVDEAHVAYREQLLGQGGMMTAKELATTFSFLRPNELVWNYVVSNYLKGKAPPAFDLLYWNSDGTNLPGPFFTWYFRNMYLENRLCRPGALKICAEAVNLADLDMPAYVYGSKEDHIVPWDASFASARLLSGDVRYILGASGHIAGVINPPAKNKRNYWSSDTIQVQQTDARQWLENAQSVPGSWWPDWTGWLAGHSGRKVKAKATQGNAAYPPLAPAPGQYVKVKA